MISLVPAPVWLLLSLISGLAALHGCVGQLDRTRAEALRGGARRAGEPAAPAADQARASPPPRAEPGAARTEPPKSRDPESTGAEVPRFLPAAAGNGTRVLRCSVKGRVSYVDPSSTCPDGSAGKITVLPR